MEKADKLKILAIIGVIVMFGGMIAPSMLGGGGGVSDNTISGDIMYGTSVANGTIRTYDRALFITGNNSREDLEFLEADEGFGSLNVLDDGWMLETKTRDDVYPVAEQLDEKGIDAVAIANIAIPGTLDVELVNGSTIEVNNRGGIVRVITRPFLEEDSRVSVMFVAGIADGLLVNVSDATLMTNDFNRTIDAEVISLVNNTYTYTIAFDKRNIDMNKLSGYDYQFDKKNVVVFSEEIPVSKQAEYRSLPYIEYIGSNSMSVNSNFSDIEKMESDLEGIGLETEPSILTVTGKSAPKLGMDHESSGIYRIMLPEEDDGLEFRDREFTLETEKELNGTIKVDVEGVSIGGKAVWVASVRPSWQSS
jgi:hypothetical protein